MDDFYLKANDLPLEINLLLPNDVPIDISRFFKEYSIVGPFLGWIFPHFKHCCGRFFPDQYTIFRASTVRKLEEELAENLGASRSGGFLAAMGYRISGWAMGYPLVN